MIGGGLNLLCLDSTPSHLNVTKKYEILLQIECRPYKGPVLLLDLL